MKKPINLRKVLFIYLEDIHGINALDKKFHGFPGKALTISLHCSSFNVFKYPHFQDNWHCYTGLIYDAIHKEDRMYEIFVSYFIINFLPKLKNHTSLKKCELQSYTKFIKLNSEHYIGQITVCFKTYFICAKRNLHFLLKFNIH